MSSGLGYPDWQKIQQWIGTPLDEATGAAIGAGAINLGPYNLASWASIVVALKPTGGKVTITVKQKLNGGPATLELDEVFVVNAGSTLFEAVVLFGDVVSVTLQGDTVGETVDYAVYPSNTTTNAQVITNATINVQHNEALVAAEQTLDFVDAAAGAGVWTIADDAANTRVKVTLPIIGLLAHGSRAASVSTSGTTFGTGADLLASPLSFTADGVSDYIVEIAAPWWQITTLNGLTTRLNLDGADAGYIEERDPQAANKAMGYRMSTIILAPAAGVHTVNARLVVGGGTATVQAGAGGAGVDRPILMTVRKA